MSLGPVPRYGEGGAQHSSKTLGRSKKIKQIFPEKIFNSHACQWFISF